MQDVKLRPHHIYKHASVCCPLAYYMVEYLLHVHHCMLSTVNLKTFWSSVLNAQQTLWPHFYQQHSKLLLQPIPDPACMGSNMQYQNKSYRTQHTKWYSVPVHPVGPALAGIGPGWVPTKTAEKRNNLPGSCSAIYAAVPATGEFVYPWLVPRHGDEVLWFRCSYGAGNASSIIIFTHHTRLPLESSMRTWVLSCTMLIFCMLLT